MAENGYVQPLVDQALDIIHSTAQKEGGFVLALAAQPEDLGNFGDMISQPRSPKPDSDMPEYTILPYEFYTPYDPDESDDSNENIIKDKFIQAMENLDENQVLMVYGVEQYEEIACRILSQCIKQPETSGKVVILASLSRISSIIQERAPEFWKTYQENQIMLPNLGLLRRVTERYHQVAALLKPMSPLYQRLFNIMNRIGDLRQNLERIKKIIHGQTRYGKVVALMNKYNPLADTIIESIQEILSAAKPLKDYTPDSLLASSNGLKTVDSAIKKSLAKVAAFNAPLQSAYWIINNLKPLMPLLYKEAGVTSRYLDAIDKLNQDIEDLSSQILELVLKSVEVGSVSSSKTTISRALTTLEGKNWNWNSLANQLSHDLVLVSKLVGAATIKSQSDNTAPSGSDTSYAFRNAIKVLGEESLRLFLTWQNNAVRMELGPDFRSIFDGIYLHTMYTVKLTERMVKIIQQEMGAMHIKPNMLTTAAQIHNLGAVFLVEYVANFLASSENVPPKDRHEYLNQIARNYPRKEEVFEDYVTSQEVMQYEKQHFGYDHTEMGMIISQKLEWPKFDPVTFIIEHHHNPVFVGEIGKIQDTPLAEGSDSLLTLLPEKNHKQTAWILYCISLADTIFELYALDKNPKQTLKSVQTYQTDLESNPAIDSYYLKITQPIRTILQKPEHIEVLVNGIQKLTSQYRTILAKANDDFMKVAFGSN